MTSGWQISLRLWIVFVCINQVSGSEIWVVGLGDNSNLATGVSRADFATFTQVNTSVLQGKTIKRVLASWGSTYVLTTDGNLYAMGRNSVGELGFGDTRNRPSLQRIPVPAGLAVVDFDGCRVTTVVALSDGYAYTAGDNTFGQLGVGDSLSRSSLTKVESLTNVSLVACSVPDNWGNDDRNIFFVRNGNQVWATGNNGGWPGVVVPGKVPVKITADSCWQGHGEIVQILSRTSQAIVVLTSDGTLCSWGPGIWLGTGSSTDHTTPVPVQVTWDPIDDGIPIRVEPLGRGHLMQTSTGSIFVWGNNDNSGLTGPAIQSDLLTPIKLNLTGVGVPFSSVASIGGGYSAAYYLNSDGVAIMSGKSWNGESCLEAPDFSGGAHFFEACHIPGDSPTGDDAKFQQISNGVWHSVFLMRSGKLFSAGLDRHGEAGTGKQTTKTRPFKARYAPSVTSNVDVSLVAMGLGALVVVDRSGSVFTSGVLPMIGCDDRSSVVPSNSPSDGSLANLALANITRNIIATNGNQPFPVASVVANGFAVIIRSQSGHVMSWGWRPGRATNVVRGSIPGFMDSLPTDPQISTLACGMLHCVLWSEANKRMYGFGDSPYGELLQLSTAEIAIELTWFHQNLVTVGIAQLDAGARANIALLTNGSVLFWGRGDYGIARPTTMPPIIYNTTSVSGTIKKVVFSRGDEEGDCILMLTDQGQVWGVGANYWGMLGHLVFSDDWSYSLLQSTALNSWFAVDLYAGEGWNYIITDQGQIVPWGSGEWGTFADGSTSEVRSDNSALAPLVLPQNTILKGVSIRSSTNPAGAVPTQAVTADISGGIGTGGIAAAIVVPLIVVIAIIVIVVVVLRRKKRQGQSKGTTELAPVSNTPNSVYSTIGAPESAAKDEKGGDDDTSEEDRRAAQRRREKSRKVIAVEGFKPEWLIAYDDLTFGKKLGQGAYGIVYRGKWRNTRVAIKQSTLAGMEPNAIAAFKKEAILMLSIRPHPNVLQVLGISVHDGSIYVILTYCEKGSLDSLFGKSSLTMDQKLHILSGVASGCRHLHESKIVHRDLAARNILLDAANTPKISDFGMSRLMDEFSLKGTTAANVGPLRWMAPESLGAAKEYSYASDVFSFAVLCNEVLTEQEPYADLELIEAAIKVRDGLRPTIPAEAPSWLADLLKLCWNESPKKRPTFEAIEHIFVERLGLDQSVEGDDSEQTSS